MFFNRPEFDRYVITNSWGSSTEFYNWEDICAVRLNLPSLSVQQKYVDIYNAMVANQQAYERGLEDLKLVCDGYIEDLRRKMTLKSIGQYIRKEDKNSNEEIKKVVGIGQSGFIAPQKEPNKSLKNYKVIKKGDICYAPPLYNVLTGALHMYREEELAVCSPIYEVFFCDTKYLLPEYLTMWLKREEFKRYAEFYALGVRQTFDYSLVEQIKIPIPSLTIQKSLSILYDAYLQRQKINEKLKVQIKSICPILIKGSLEEK
jgi:type I restriction enzyme S subunit